MKNAKKITKLTVNTHVISTKKATKQTHQAYA